jgi:hypothetical protein
MRPLAVCRPLSDVRRAGARLRQEGRGGGRPRGPGETLEAAVPAPRTRCSRTSTSSSELVTDAVMQDVVKLRSLAMIHMEWTRVGDAGLAELTELRLHSLGL